MQLIKPFSGLRPNVDIAQQIIAPPYDVISSNQARELARNNPYSFLHISKPEIDLPEDFDPYANEVYAKGAENFEAMQQQGWLVQDKHDCFYIYRMRDGDHEQIGLVAAASVAAYEKQSIRKNEFTRPKKVNDRVNIIKAQQAITSPVFLTFHANRSTTEILSELANSQQPTYSVKDSGNVIHQFWVIDNATKIEEISVAFNSLEMLYIADGHHRSEAAAQIAKQYPNNPACQHFLSVIFPDDQTKILGYHRVIADLNGLTASELLEKLEENFVVTLSQKALQPQQKFSFGLYLKGQWHQLDYRNKQQIDNHELDINLLTKAIIEPLFNITDPRVDNRIDFIGGKQALSEMRELVDSGKMAVAFSLYPTSMSELLTVADRNDIMPPKSTWFEPKLVDGLVSYLYENA